MRTGVIAKSATQLICVRFEQRPISRQVPPALLHNNQQYAHKSIGCWPGASDDDRAMGRQLVKQEIVMQTAMDSCVTKGVISGGAGEPSVLQRFALQAIGGTQALHWAHSSPSCPSPSATKTR